MSQTETNEASNTPSHPHTVVRSKDAVVRPTFWDHAMPAVSLLVAMTQISTHPTCDGIELWITLVLQLATAFLFCLIATASIMRTAIYYATRSNVERDPRFSRRSRRVSRSGPRSC